MDVVIIEVVIIQEELVVAREWHWWAVTKDSNSRPYLVYLCPDKDGGESLARQRGIELMRGLDFELVRYRTYNIAQARAFLAGKRLQSGIGLQESSRRQGHEKSLARLVAKRQKRQMGLG